MHRCAGARACALQQFRAPAVEGFRRQQGATDAYELGHAPVKTTVIGKCPANVEIGQAFHGSKDQFHCGRILAGAGPGRSQISTGKIKFIEIMEIGKKAPSVVWSQTNAIA